MSAPERTPEREAALAAIWDLLAGRGAAMYGGEAVTQCQHALQTAALAKADGAGDALVLAALFHDIGHLFFADDAADTRAGIDRRHELVSARHLSELFPETVSEPVRLHVAAKRWLCATDASYLEGLSEGSVLSLQAQGGPFDADAAAAFIRQPHAVEAVALRRWDDLAKDPSARVPPLEAYRAMARAMLRPA